ncbi:MAG: TMEM165/GDT1 family protein [Micromonosporaceae bacterium]|nr:TMEM165/GDT1 family protein [Micromonosporaceae bacterium]
MDEFLLAAGTAFALVVPIELPDKTFVATLVLATKYRAVQVWFGVFAAFGVQSLVAVTAGRLVALLPARPVHLVAGGMFAIGAVLLVRSARSASLEAREQEEEYEQRSGRMQRDPARPGLANRNLARRNAVLASFIVLFFAEWGDLSQLLTAGLVARGGQPVGVFLGSWIGLGLVSGAAVVLGRVLLKYVSLTVVQYVGAGVCTLLAVVTLIQA